MRPSRLRRHSAAITAAAAMAATREPLKSSRTITAKWRVAVRIMARVQGGAVAVWKGAQGAAATMAAAAVVTEAGKVCENECGRFASPLPPMLS